MQAKILARFLLAFGLGMASVALATDFNGDGRQDVLWRLPSGNPLIWQMNGLAVAAQQTVASSLGANAAIIGTGNFFGNGSDTIAWLDSSDELRLWEIGADGAIMQNCVAMSGIDQTWKFLAIANVNNNGRDDVLWRLDNGSVVASSVDGCNATTTLNLSSAADATWTFAGSADPVGPGLAGLWWTDAGTNNVIVWTLTATGVVSQSTIPAGAQAGWTIAAIADFNGDRLPDLLWRSPSGTSLTLWLAQGNGYVATPITAAAGVFGAVDAVFANGFDTRANPAPPLSSDWTILGAADYDGDGKADLLLTNSAGNSAVWLMNGASVQTTARFAPIPDMPLPGLTGWRLPLDRPTVTKIAGQVTVDWNALTGSANYAVYASATNAPASTGTVVSNAPPPLSFERMSTGYADKRYFAVSASYHGLTLPPSKEAYIVEFTPVINPASDSFAVADVNGDGCPDIFREFGDCHGNFEAAGLYAMGLDTLYPPANIGLRDIRLADFNGDGIPDIIADVYTCDSDSCSGATANSRIQLLFGNGDGTYTQAAGFNADNEFGGGYGETVVVADFNNDGCLDIFLPRYTYYDPAAHNLLLINDCHGNFTDLADTAGVAMRNTNEFLRPEGAQALDVNGDGWIDLYAGSELFINNGNLTFTNVGITDDPSGVTSTSPWGIAPVFDEGAKFVDCDNSGQPCLALNAVNGLRVFKFDGLAHFSEMSIVPAMYMNQSWGFTAADVDGDGRSDLVVAGGIDQSIATAPQYAALRGQLADSSTEGDLDLDDVLDTSQTPNAMPQLLINRGQYVIHDFYDDGLTPSTRVWNDSQAFGDFDFSGTEDLVTRFQNTVVLMNQARSDDVIIVSALGTHGEQNQQGRIVRMTPNARPDVTMLQIVDSGSGYMSNGPYDLTFATPYFGAYTISVRFANATYTAVAHSGDHVTMYANGSAAIRPRQ